MNLSWYRKSLFPSADLTWRFLPSGYSVNYPITDLTSGGCFCIKQCSKWGAGMSWIIIQVCHSCHEWIYTVQYHYKVAVNSLQLGCVLWVQIVWFYSTIVTVQYDTMLDYVKTFPCFSAFFSLNIGMLSFVYSTSDKNPSFVLSALHTFRVLY